MAKVQAMGSAQKIKAMSKWTSIFFVTNFE